MTEHLRTQPPLISMQLEESKEYFRYNSKTGKHLSFACSTLLTITSFYFINPVPS